MTVKLVVLYPQPDDPAAFDEHYLGVHMPLVHQMPGLQRAEAARCTRALDGGDQPYHRIAELYFADAQALRDALGSAEGQAVAADFQQIAPEGSRLIMAEVDE